MVWGLIAAFFYAGYRINKTDHERIQTQLKARSMDAANKESQPVQS
jgi:Na+/melibiose symporter-like transporter